VISVCPVESDMDTMMIKHSHNDIRRLRPISRRYPRGKLHDFSADIADGKFFASGRVDDISLSGFKMSDVSDSFRADKYSYTVVISGKGWHLKVLVKPCWKKKNNENYEIGFKIVDAPWEWAEFAISAVQTDNSQDWVGNA
jgi:hypothetical protein